MLDRICVLLGPGGSGKTGVFVLLENWLRLNGYEIIEREGLGGDPRDFWCIVQRENRRVYVQSMGDYRNLLENAVAYAIEQACDTVILAYNWQFSQTLVRQTPPGGIILQKRIAQDENERNRMNQLDLDEIIRIAQL